MPKQTISPFPKYLQLREALRRELEVGYALGDRLPTEHALVRDYGVSRETVRDALRGLEEEGIVLRVRGQGTFLARRPAVLAERRLTGLTEDFSALKLDTEARVLERGVVTSPASVAEIMGLPPGVNAYRISRLRLFSRNHLAHHEAFLPLEIGARVARLDLRRTSIMHELSETLGYDYVEDHQRIEAAVADAGMAQLLRVQPGDPLLRVTRLFLMRDRAPIVLFRSHFRADRYYYTVRLAADRAPKGAPDRQRPVRGSRTRRPTGNAEREGVAQP